MLQFIKFALFDINTGDKLHEMDNIPIFIPKTSNIFKYLKQIYPMFDISLYRVGTINTMIGLSDKQKNALMQSQIDNHGDNLLDALCLGTPLDEDVYQHNVAHEPTLFGSPIITTNITPVDNDNEYNGEEDIDHYNPGLSTPDFKGE